MLLQTPLFRKVAFLHFFQQKSLISPAKDTFHRPTLRRCKVRLIGWLLLILLALGWLASELPSPAGRTEAAAKTDWRRTRDGWERPTWIAAATASTSGRMMLHPALVGLLEVSLALAVLIAFGRDERSVRPPRPEADPTHSCRNSQRGPYRFVTATKPAQLRHVFTRRPSR